MRTVLVVPGVCGTTLGYDPGGGRRLWVDYTRIALGEVGALRLAPDGTSPGPPDGVQLYPGPPLPDYYGPCVAALAGELVPQGYAVQGWGYDWRRLARTSGALLAARVREVATADEPASIVAHSFGGLVARAAWSALAATGETGLVRRIVTIGTPHQGSYGAVAVWSLDSQQLVQVQQLTLATSAVLSLISPLVAPQAWTQEDLAALSASWPSLYETLPLVGGSDAAGDPGRAAVYGSTWPAGRRVSRAWLDYAAGEWAAWMLSPATMPPPHVLTTVAGTGAPTPDRLAHPSLLGLAVAYNSAADGDGVVTAGSALVAGAAQVRVVGYHADLPNQLGTGLRLGALVTAERVPPAPVPPPATVPGPIVPELAGPPIPFRLAGNDDC